MESGRLFIARWRDYHEDLAFSGHYLIQRAKRLYFQGRAKIIRQRENNSYNKLPEFGETVVVDGIKMRIDPRMSEFNIRKLLAGRHTRHERALIVPELRDGDIVMELGGGIGMVAIACAQRLGSERVISYEANPELEGLIRDNYALNRVSPTLRMCMLGPDQGTRTFHVAKHFSRSSAQIAEAGARAIEVPVERFNDHLKSSGATVLIVDIQGAEVELFDYADLEQVRAILVELHPFISGLRAMLHVRRRLRAANFQLIGRRGQSFLYRRG